MSRSIASTNDGVWRRLPLLLVLFAILLVGADPTPRFLGVASPNEHSKPTPPDRTSSSGFILPVSMAVAASVQHESAKTAKVELGLVATIVPEQPLPPASRERFGPDALSTNDGSFGSSIRLRC